MNRPSKLSVGVILALGITSATLHLVGLYTGVIGPFEAFLWLTMALAFSLEAVAEYRSYKRVKEL